MNGLKKLALASAVLAVSTGAFAMEAMQDDALANTTGQDGLTILQTNLAVSIAAVRYTDSDGTTGASTALGIANLTSPPYPVAFPAQSLVDSFASAGSLQIQNLSITASSILTTIDVGSTSTTAGGVTGLLVASQITNLNVNLGKISLDNGNELAADATTGNSTAANGGTTDLGGVALTNINLPSFSAMLITAGAADVKNNTGGTGYTSGITIQNLVPIADLSLTINYYNTNLTSYNAGTGLFTAVNTTAGHGDDGLISIPVDIRNILTGTIEVAAGEAAVGTVANPDAYHLTNTQGLEIYTSGTLIGSIDLGNQANGGTGINITGSTVGSVGIIGLNIGSSQLNISGH